MNDPSAHDDELRQLRTAVDIVDARLLDLLQTRQHLTNGIADRKGLSGDVPAYARLLPMLQARKQGAEQRGLSPELITHLFTRIAEHNMAAQRQHANVQDWQNKPLVYACSGCSSAAQLANDLAVSLDREGSAEMSCIAGVGGEVPTLCKVLEQARGKREILVLDGCPLQCAARCLAQQDAAPTWHITLSDLGIKRHSHKAYSADDYLRAKSVSLATLGLLAEVSP